MKKLILQVINPDEKTITWIDVDPKYFDMVRAIDNKCFNSNNNAVEAFVKECGGDMNFDPIEVGTEINDITGMGQFDFVCFWYDD